MTTPIYVAILLGLAFAGDVGSTLIHMSNRIDERAKEALEFVLNRWSIIMVVMAAVILFVGGA